MTAAGFEIHWDAWLERTYQVDYKTNAVQSLWTDFTGPILATNGLMKIQDSVQTAGRFYRLRQIIH
ncbi:MAG: hypothetical protein QM813_16890 [Verrucomicrobiota bacterium]